MLHLIGALRHDAVESSWIGELDAVVFYRPVVARWFVQIFILVVVGMGREQPAFSPFSYGRRMDAELFGDFSLRQHPRAAQTVVAASDPVGSSNLTNQTPAEGRAHSRAQSLLIELVCDLSLREIVEQSLDRFKDPRTRLPKFPGIQRPRQVQRLDNASLESHVSRDLAVVDERNVFHQQPHYSLAVSIRRLRIVP